MTAHRPGHWLTISEYAKSKGVARETVEYHIRKGTIKVNGRPKKLDTEQADRALAAALPLGQILSGQVKLVKLDVPRGTESTVDGDHLEKPDQETGPLSADTNLFEARRIREVADAGRAKLAEEREGLHLLKIKGELMSVDDHLRTVSDMILETKARVMAVAARVAPLLQNETSRVMIQATVEKALRDALEDLAGRVPKYIQPELTDDDFSLKKGGGKIGRHETLSR